MTNSEIIKKIFSHYIKNTGKSKFFLVIFFWIFSSLLMYLEPIFFTQIIKSIESFLKTWIFDLNEFFRLMFYWWFFIILSTWVMLVYKYFFIAKTTINNHVNLANKYSEKIINMNYQTYLSKDVWKIYKRFNRWMDMHFDFLIFFFWELIKSVSWIILVVIILFYTNIQMAFITLSLLPIMIIIWILFFKKLYPVQQVLDKKWDSIYSDLWNIMSVFSLVKTLRIEKLFSNKIKDKLNYCEDKQLKVSKWWTIAEIYTVFFTTVTRFIVLWAGVFLLKDWEITFATLFLFFLI